jgi:hypothetical protein
VRFLQLSLLRTGEELRRDFVDPAQLDRAKICALQEAFADPARKAPLRLPGWEHVTLQHTGSEDGAALTTFWAEGKIAASGVLVAGRTPATESEVLGMFHDSIARTRMAMESGVEDPFVEFLIEERRPASFQVVWPIVPPEDYARWEDIGAHAAAAFFTMIGVERDASA